MRALSLKEIIWKIWTQHSNKFFLRCKTWYLATSRKPFALLRNSFFIWIYFYTVFPTLRFNTQFTMFSHELNPFHSDMAIILSRVRLRWVLKKQTTVPPSQPLFFWPALPSRVVGGHNTWAPSTKCQLTKSPGHRQKMQIQQLHSKAQTVSCENAPDQGASRKSERPHGTPFRYFISVMWAWSFRFSAISFFSMFDFRRICVSRILTYMHIYIIIHMHRYSWRMPAFMHLSCFL